MDTSSPERHGPTRLLGLLAAALLVAVIALGAFALGHHASKPGPGAKAASSAPAASSSRRFDFTLLNQIHDFLAREYVKPDNLDDQTLYESAIDGMLSSLDDSGTYYL